MTLMQQNTISNYIFATGVPGSGWSGICRRFKNNYPNMDNSDENLSRTYELPTTHTQNFKNSEDKKLHTHSGSYYGPYHEFGHTFDDLSKFQSSSEFIQECDKAFGEASNKVRLIKSHWFSYNLDWLWENCKGAKLLIIHRGDDESFDWWTRMGGWSITYPTYTWYENDSRMKLQISIENRNIETFVQKHSGNWYDIDDDFSWMKSCLDIEPIKSQVLPDYGDFPRVCLMDIV